MFHRFTKSFDYDHPTQGKITYPRNWAGELDAEVEAAAKAANVLLMDPATATPVPVNETVAKNNKDAVKLAKAQADLVAAQKTASEATVSLVEAQRQATDAIDALAGLKASVLAVNDAKAKLSAAVDDTAKAEAETELNRAETALAALIAA